MGQDTGGSATGGAAMAAGLFKTVGSLFGGGKRRREQRRAKREYDAFKTQYENLDTSNLFLGQDNMFEDLTVNQQETQFRTEQQNQGLANILDSQRQAAGGSGIAALSQALANQQSLNIQQTAAGLGQQERQNAILQAQAADRIQQQEIQGAAASRSLVYDKTETLLGMSQQRLAAANQARKEATQSLVGGIGNIVGGALSGGIEAAQAASQFLKG